MNQVLSSCASPEGSSKPGPIALCTVYAASTIFLAIDSSLSDKGTKSIFILCVPALRGKLCACHATGVVFSGYMRSYEKNIKPEFLQPVQI